LKSKRSVKYGARKNTTALDINQWSRLVWGKNFIHGYKISKMILSWALNRMKQNVCLMKNNFFIPALEPGMFKNL
jgi:hypothetical protein